MARSLLAAAVTAGLVAVLGLVVALSAPTVYRAAASAVVLPGPSAPNPAYFRALADGQVAAGFASGVAAIADAQGEGQDATVTVSLAPRTSALTIAADAGTPGDAATAANRVLYESTLSLNASRPPFVLVAAGRAEPDSARPTGVTIGAELVVLACVAAAGGLAALQVTWLWSAFAPRRRARP